MTMFLRELKDGEDEAARKYCTKAEYITHRPHGRAVPGTCPKCVLEYNWFRVYAIGWRPGKKKPFVRTSSAMLYWCKSCDKYFLPSLKLMKCDGLHCR